MERRRLLATAGTAGLVGLAGCLDIIGTGSGGTPPEYDVGMGASFFDPAEITVSVGETVVWLNTGSRAHTVTAYETIPDDAEFFASGGYDGVEAARKAWRRKAGGAIYSEETYEHTFEVAGQHDYFCVPHERMGMVGTVHVEE